MLQVFRRLFRSCGSRPSIQMPTDRFSVLLDLNGEIAIQGTLIQPVVALRPIAIQRQLLDVDNEHVSRHCSRYVKRAGLGIAAEGPLDSIHVGPASIHCSGVNGISRINRKDWFITGRYLTIEDGRLKFMGLGLSVRQSRSQNR